MTVVENTCSQDQVRIKCTADCFRDEFFAVPILQKICAVPDPCTGELSCIDQLNSLKQQRNAMFTGGGMMGAVKSQSRDDRSVTYRSPAEMMAQKRILDEEIARLEFECGDEPKVMCDPCGRPVHSPNLSKNRRRLRLGSGRW